LRGFAGGGGCVWQFWGIVTVCSVGGHTLSVRFHPFRFG
jgi:hypothetical protein